jgi:hypothetical protein
MVYRDAGSTQKMGYIAHLPQHTCGGFLSPVLYYSCLKKEKKAWFPLEYCGTTTKAS